MGRSEIHTDTLVLWRFLFRIVCDFLRFDDCGAGSPDLLQLGLLRFDGIKTTSVFQPEGLSIKLLVACQRFASTHAQKPEDH